MKYDRLLENRRAVVTGGARDGGREIALLFAKQGATVAIIDNVLIDTKEVLDELLAISPGHKAYTADLSNMAAVDEVCADVLNDYGSINLLVNAVNEYKTDITHNIKDADFIYMISVNLKCAIHCTKAFVKGMCDNRLGNIINITSDMAITSIPSVAAIAACAGGIHAFTRNVTMDYTRYFVKANCVMFPFDNIEGREPITGTPDFTDIANAALWFSCDFSRFIIGEALPLNGGLAYFEKHAVADRTI